MSTKRIDIGEFRRAGYLQEINRRLLHPLGLALEVVVEEDGTERLGGVWDYRDDPEGIRFNVDVDALDAAACAGFRDRAVQVALAWERRREARVAALGFMVQPIAPLVNEPLT